MMKTKGFELAISTIVLLALGMILLFALAYFVTDGFKSFRSSTDPLISTTEVAAVKQACNLACSSDDKFSYCCNKIKLNNEDTTCLDSRLEINCDISCAAYSCLR